MLPENAVLGSYPPETLFLVPIRSAASRRKRMGNDLDADTGLTDISRAIHLSPTTTGVPLMAQEINLTDGVIRVLAAGATQLIQQAVDVGRYDQLDLMLTLIGFEGSTPSGFAAGGDDAADWENPEGCS